ncbi:hypothetical protein [Kribbella shirazensis]|uniref:Uncharacterized protein n=1 Tax=Kribbella shirazensis TaxID=1105143 RepID=A0A7X5VAV3_9ACTN|nr:hypothetical protein [Kribbella shirazensis]NIK57835.1 hypothetical protein [Kribbella shirazensis]
MTAQWLGWGRQRLVGWLMVSSESERLLAEPGAHAADLGVVRAEGNGVYRVGGGAERFRLVRRVEALDPGVTFEYAVAGGNVPVVELTLSERLPVDEVAPVLARALAESAAVIRGRRTAAARGTAVGVRGDSGLDGDRVFGPGSAPEVDVVQRPVDVGLRAELRQRGRSERTGGPVRRAAVRREIRRLALRMGVADGQANAPLLRTLLSDEEREVLERAKDGRRPLEDRVDSSGYLARAVGGSGVSSVMIGAAAAAFTGNPLVGVGIAVPTIVNAAVGAYAERRLDQQKMAGRKPAYAADTRQREYDYPGLRGLLDGPERVRPAVVELPRATAWRNYLRRYAMPTLATAAVAGTLTVFGVPAMSTALVIASSALAKSLAERLIDTKKLEFRLRRMDATERLRLADPRLYVNQVATEFADLRARLDRVVADLQPAGNPVALPPASSDVPGTPPLTVGLAAQLIENVSGTARRAFLGGRPATDVDPTAVARSVGPQLEGLLGSAGPGLVGALTGALGDKYFLNRDELARDASKRWSRSHQETAQATALASIVEPQLRALRELVDHLETSTGGADSSAGAPAGVAGRLPTVAGPPVGPRPVARAPKSAYVVQAAAGPIGGVSSAVALDLVFDLPDLVIVLTTAGAAGSLLATPVSRYLFRQRELQVHEGLEEDKAVRAVNQSELLEQRAVTRYLMTQLSMRAETIVERIAPPGPNDPPPQTPDVGAVGPAVGTVGRRGERQAVGGVTAQVRYGVPLVVRQLAAEPSGKPLLAERLLAVERLVQAADAVDHHAQHGTPESRAFVQDEFDTTRAEADRLWREAGVPDGLVMPALSKDTAQRTTEDERLRRMVAQLVTTAGAGETHAEAQRPAVARGRRPDEVSRER